MMFYCVLSQNIHCEPHATLLFRFTTGAFEMKKKKEISQSSGQNYPLFGIMTMIKKGKL